MISINDFCKKLKRQYINLSLMNAASLKDYSRYLFPFCAFYLFGAGKSIFPFNITLELTYKCNLNCKFCFLSFQPDFLTSNGEPPLTYVEIKELVDSLKGKNTTFLITGGEPTVREDFLSIIKLIKVNKFRCGIFTNATILVQGMSDSLIRYGLDYICFSLDGPKSIHDKLRADGAFDKTYSNIEYISRTRKRPNPKIIMNVLIFPENYRRLAEIVDIACKLKIDGIAFDFLTFLNGKEFDAHKRSFKKDFPCSEFKSLIYVKDFSDEDLQDLPDMVRKVKIYARAKKVKVFFKPDLTREEIRRWHDKDFKFDRRCIYPRSVLRVSPYGDIYPCAQFYLKIGNIRKNTIEEIWNNERFSNFRNMLKKRKLFPGCNRCVKL